ncbi:MAG: hypothetical protein GY828_03225, partial [Candidatus Gracilibacteria bacterium]|nr:hypothetical protein [Candidatus Gracilibacteria bacterium]
ADIKNLLIGSIGGILFIGFQLFNYGQQYFPGVILGLSFGLLAIIYFALSYFMMEKIGLKEVKSEVSAKNTVFSYLFISISLFSLAIALVFAKSPEIISTVWLFEATILFYFYTKTSEEKIYTLGIILFIIGILQLFDISAGQKEFLFLIPFTLIFGSFVLNLKYLDTTTGAAKVLHDLFHILGIGTLGYFLMEIIPSTGHGWSLLGISVFIALLGFIYAQVSSKILKIFFIFIYIISLLLHIEKHEHMFHTIDMDELSYLRVLQYVAFGIFIGASALWNKYNTLPGYNKVVNGTASLYTLLIVSGFILDIFDTTFAVTLFWAIVSSILLFYGISTNKIKLRTIGLYLFSLVLGKIFLYDLLYGLDDAITRVFALIIIGVLLIVISTKYTKKYGNNLKGEFDFGNINEAPEKKKE